MKRLSTVSLSILLSYGTLACATQPPIVTTPSTLSKPAANIPAVAVSPGLNVHTLENPKGPWKFTYTPGTYRYTIVTTAKIALQTDTTVEQDIPTISEQASIAVTNSGDIQVIDPPPSTSVTCDTMAALVTRAQQLLPKIPAQLTANSTW